MQEYIAVIASLICLMLANITLGGRLAVFKNEYDKKKFAGGISKALNFLLGLILIYLSTRFYPIKVGEINGKLVTTLDGAILLLKAANILYGGKVLIKLKDILQVDVSVQGEEESQE